MIRLPLWMAALVMILLAPDWSLAQGRGGGSRGGGGAPSGGGSRSGGGARPSAGSPSRPSVSQPASRPSTPNLGSSRPSGSRPNISQPATRPNPSRPTSPPVSRPSGGLAPSARPAAPPGTGSRPNLPSSPTSRPGAGGSAVAARPGSRPDTSLPNLGNRPGAGSLPVLALDVVSEIARIYRTVPDRETAQHCHSAPDLTARAPLQEINRTSAAVPVWALNLAEAAVRHRVTWVIFLG